MYTYNIQAVDSGKRVPSINILVMPSWRKLQKNHETYIQSYFDFMLCVYGLKMTYLIRI